MLKTTPLEVATIAAQLMPQCADENEAAQMALRLIEACDKAMNPLPREYEYRDSLLDELKALKRDKNGLIPLDTFVRVGGSTVGVARKRFREFLRDEPKMAQMQENVDRHSINADLDPQVSDDQVEDVMKKYRRGVECDKFRHPERDFWINWRVWLEEKHKISLDPKERA